MNGQNFKIAGITRVTRPINPQNSTDNDSVMIESDIYYPTISIPSVSDLRDYFGFQPLTNMFSGLFTLIFLGIIIAGIGYLLAALIGVIFVYLRGRTYYCEKCGKTFRIRGKISPKFCEKCGNKLTPPKCP